MSKNKLVLLNRSVDLSGPSIGLGILCMFLGTASFIAGIGISELIVVFIGIVFLLIATFLIFSIECISIDRENNRLFLFKEYFLIKKDRYIHIDDFETVCIYFHVERAGRSGMS